MTQSIRIGPWKESIAALPTLGDAPTPIVTDEKVWGLYGDDLARALDVYPIVVPRGEDAKSWTHLQAIIEQLAARNHARSAPLIALGGGSIGDLSGFAASIYRRGAPLVQIPTTLLSQVDSSVGGKTAIDAAGQKNLVGTFHPASLVIVDPAFLSTLDARQIRSGIAEATKYGAIGDENFFAGLKARMPALLSAEVDTCTEVISHCIEAKQSIVDDDPRDLTGRRALLNFGHTFGHAIESERGHGTILHGEAVAAGMVLAARYSETSGAAAPGTAGALADTLSEAGLPTDLESVGIASGQTLLPWMLKDKKNASAHLTLILLRGVGEAFVASDVTADSIGAFLEAC